MLRVNVLTVVEGEITFGASTFKIGEVRINGFTDRDGDGDVEVGVAVNLGGAWITGSESEFRNVELPTSAVVDALKGAEGAFDALVGLIGKRVG